MHDEQLLRFDRFTLDLMHGCLRTDDGELKLRPKSFDVLAYLVRNPGRLVGKDELVNAIWRDVVVTDNSLAQCVRDIRSALSDDGERFIRTLPRRGYMFVAKVERLIAPPQSLATAEESAHSPHPTTGNAVDSSLPAATGGRRPRFRLPISWALALALLLGIALVAAVEFARPGPTPLPPMSDLRIVVIPFTSQGDDRHLSDGLTEDLTTELSRFRDITVIARNAASRYRGETDPAKIVAALGTAFIVRGSLARDGNAIRVTVQLIEAQTGAVRWAERYEREMATLFALQDEMAERIVAVLVAHAKHVAAQRTRSRPPATLEVYELVLKARSAFGNYGAASSDEALALLEQALRFDPDYPAAWSMLARVHLRLYLHPLDHRHLSPQVLEQAHQAARTAVSLDPNFSTAHASLGYTMLWQHRYDESVALLRKAIALNPNDSTAYFYYGDALARAGEQRASIDALERALQLDPFAPTIVRGAVARAHLMLGENQKALALARECADRTPDASACLVVQAIAATALGLPDEAVTARQRLLKVYPGYSIGRWIRRFKHDRDEAAFVAHLRRAGFPE